MSQSTAFKFPIVKDIDNRPIDFSFPNKKAALLIFFNTENILHREIASYVNVLYRRYQNLGFDAVGISNQNIYATRELRSYNQISYRFVSDEKGEYPKCFQISACCGGAVLIGKDSEILFKASSLPSPEDIRQLVEKEILGKIIYEFTPVPSHIETLGNRVLDLPLLDISAAQITSLAQILRKPLVVTFISSYCSICDSGKRIEAIKRAKNRSIQKGSSVDFIIVFSKPYTEQDLIEMENRSQIPFQKFISFDDAFSETEKYLTDPNKKLDPITVFVGKDRSIQIIDTPRGQDSKLIEKLVELIGLVQEHYFYHP